MIIMNETQLSIVSKLENIAEREEKKADSFLATALRTANQEGRSDILNLKNQNTNFYTKDQNCLRRF